MKLSIKNNNSNSISRNTAENALQRILQFLRAVGTDPNIMNALRETGFTDAAMKQGWALVLTAYAAANGPAATSITDSPINEATSKVEAWQSTMFARTHAALQRFHPEQGAFVFDNLEMGTGIAAVPAVATFLDRLDALENAPERKATRKADHAALATLEERGVTKEQRKQIRSTVKWIESTPAQPVAPSQESPRDAALYAIYEWVQDWTECARTVITRRDQLIRLGIGKRRSRKALVQPPPAPTPVPAPVVAAPAPVVPPDAASTNPVALQMARPVLALPQKTNGASPGSMSIGANGGEHA